jgi:copper resistance protein B
VSARLARAARGAVLSFALFAPLAGVGAQALPGGVPHTTSMMLDQKIRLFTLADLLEYVPAGEGSVRVDGLAWIGGDYNRLYLRLDGEQSVTSAIGETAADVTYGRLVSPFWTALVGGRLETRRTEGTGRSTRGLLALGFEGISPYWFELEPTVYVSKDGQVSGRLATSVDLLFTQRLILQPRLETHFGVQRVPEFGVGSGINDVELGARLRYEFRRELAPYVGLTWFRRTGEAAGLARSAGEAVKESGIVLGVRMWH